MNASAEPGASLLPELAVNVVRLLEQRGETAALAETTAGGLAIAALIAVPGASRVTPGGLVAYANGPKVELLRVKEDLLREHGAVSAECAAAMADGVRDLFGVTWGLAETGIAGPGGGAAGKPPGIIFAAIAGPGGAATDEWRFTGSRRDVMEQAAAGVLRLLLHRLENA